MRGVADGNHRLCIFSMDTSEITEHSLIFLFFLTFMKISELWNEDSVFSCDLQS